MTDDHASSGPIDRKFSEIKCRNGMAEDITSSSFNISGKSFHSFSHSSLHVSRKEYSTPEEFILLLIKIMSSSETSKLQNHLCEIKNPNSESKEPIGS